jgi:hypothetical protein
MSNTPIRNKEKKVGGSVRTEPDEGGSGQWTPIFSTPLKFKNNQNSPAGPPSYRNE